MQYGICHLSIVPVRKEPEDKSEQVSQLLFGEHFSIIEKREKWVKIGIFHDSYQGWIDFKQFQPLSEENYLQLNLTQPVCTKSVLSKLNVLDHLTNSTSSTDPLLSIADKLTKSTYSLSNELSDYKNKLSFPDKNLNYTPYRNQLNLVYGSILPFYTNGECRINDQLYSINTEDVFKPDNFKEELLFDFVSTFLNTPYLWGGRSPFGIDCSGLVQVFFRLAAYNLPRDASMQVHSGFHVASLEKANTGDLAFFANEHGKIIHVGILLDTKRILHASGQVRIDLIDNEGVFNVDRQAYTHKLAAIRTIAD